MKRILFVAIMILTACRLAALAGGWSQTFSLTPGLVALTNSQDNSVWTPVAVMLNFTAPRSGTAEVWRVSQEHSFMLANCAFTNVSTVVWVPDAPYPFNPGEVLILRSSVTNGIVQVIRKGD